MKQWSKENKESKVKSSRKWNLANKDKVKGYATKSQLKNKFGITLDQYNEMLRIQNGLCAICFQPETVIDKRNNKVIALAVDHNHITGEVRGLLCARCNISLGGFQDSPENLKNAALYLERYKTKS